MQSAEYELIMLSVIMLIVVMLSIIAPRLMDAVTQRTKNENFNENKKFFMR
jgi:hypothetical protein